MPEMKRLTVRFGLALWSELEQEAEMEAISAAQFIREAALAAVIRRRALRGEPVDRVAEEVAGKMRQDAPELEDLEHVIADVYRNAPAELRSIIQKVDARSQQWIRDNYGLPEDF